MSAWAVEHDAARVGGNFGSHTKASVVAFQAWGGGMQDGVVGDQTWAVSLHAATVS